MFALMSLHCSSCSLGSVRSAFLTIWVNYPGRTGICSSSPNSNSTRIVLVDGEKPENLEIKPENPEKNRRTRRKPGEPGEKQENPEKTRRTRRKTGEPGENTENLEKNRRTRRKHGEPGEKPENPEKNGAKYFCSWAIVV